MLLSERKNKRYIIVIDQYDDNLGRHIPKRRHWSKLLSAVTISVIRV